MILPVNQDALPGKNWPFLEEKKKKPKTALILAVTIGIVLIVLGIRPVVIGYNTYQNVVQSNYTLEEYGENIRDLKLQAMASRENASYYMTLNEEIKNEWNKATESLATCSKDKDVVTAEWENNKNAAQEKEVLLEKELSAKEKQLDDATAKHQQELTTLKQEHTTELENIKTTCDNKTKTLEQEKNTAESNFAELLKNSAYNICCKQKIDNPNIDAYSIINNKISCGEDGTYGLSC